MSAPETCIVAIDPGLSGAVAILISNRLGLISVYDMPLAGSEVDAAALARIIGQMSPTLGIVEQVAARPGQGVSSMFRFGTSYGVARGVISAMGIPCHLVTPGKWKRHFRLSADKEEARALAVRLWPQSPHFERKKDHGRAEAALLARYAAETIAAAGGPF
ncbi:hypothetical protein GCM10011390_10370 [Aureimonas endophytica]|uniref:Uncharacterized protein n=1 Tax=Aureimonas endophytica TaxID=2027858 RepID=A0A916ZF16_9HYPH|nr:hypothetical protein [Aureimonas endophytica]GGD93517.1 hypothetical protein GCM10011390_10370 [Aureimonas endophytica]